MGEGSKKFLEDDEPVSYWPISSTKFGLTKEYITNSIERAGLRELLLYLVDYQVAIDDERIFNIIVDECHKRRKVLRSLRYFIEDTLRSLKYDHRDRKEESETIGRALNTLDKFRQEKKRRRSKYL